MVGRGPGAVGCAHCRLVGATAECRVCRRTVCPACAADWTTCEVPSGRVVRLGRGARLRDVDPMGRLGLVSRLTGRMRLFDLRRLRWVKGPGLPRMTGAAWREPCLTGDGRILVPTYSIMGNDGADIYDGVARIDLASDAREVLDVRRPAHGIAMSAVGDRYWYICSDETVEVVFFQQPKASAGPSALVGFRGPDFAARTLDPLPGKVVQSAHVDGERDLLAAGTWGTVTLHRFGDDDRPTLAARLQTTGDVRWVSVAGAWLVALVDQKRLLAWELDEQNHAASSLVVDRELSGRVFHASQSRDGGHIALGFGNRTVEVIGLRAGVSAIFDEHSDDLTLVRFVGEDHLLVTADADNRVVLRPRIAGRYATTLIPIPVRSAAIPIGEALTELRPGVRHLRVRD